jgi:predicted TIM-barrel fold metal-dependent hydrolase
MAAVDLETVIDGDGHVFEDALAISGHLPDGFKEHGPFPMSRLFPPLDHLHSAHIATMPPDSFEQTGPDGWKEFLKDAAIDSTVLYPTAALSYGKIASIEFATAVTRAYNDWLYESYLQNDSRFKGMALIPMQDPAAAVKELRRAVVDLGMCGAMLPSTGLKAHLGSREYWPIYAEAERLGCCLGIHGGCHSGLGFDDMNVYPAVHGLGHPFGQMISFSGILLNGIYDRFPNIRIGFLEGGVSWLLLCLERLNESYSTHIPFDPDGQFLRLQQDENVAEYIIRQMKEGRIFVGCEGGEFALPYAAKVCGPEAFMYSSDFPHEVNRALVRHEIQEILESDEMNSEAKEAILHKNAVRFYKFQPVR